MFADLPSDAGEDGCGTEFFQQSYWQSVATAYVQFACIPVILILVMKDCKAVAAVVICLVFTGSTRFQFWMIGRLRLFLQRQRQEPRDIWECHARALLELRNGSSSWMPCISSSAGTWMLGIIEAVDPALDAWQAASALHTFTEPIKKKFAASWEPVPLVGRLVAWLGMPCILLLILLVATILQLLELHVRILQFNFLMEEARVRHESCEVVLDAKVRRSLWYNWKHTADIGGLMLLHDVFGQLVLVETKMDPSIYPLVDRVPTFMPKVFAEALPSLWFQISMLSLTIESVPTGQVAMNLLSICSSMICIAQQLRLMAEALYTIIFVMKRLPRRWYYIPAFVISLCCFPVCVIRLAGVWLCSSHVLLISAGCV